MKELSEDNNGLSDLNSKKMGQLMIGQVLKFSHPYLRNGLTPFFNVFRLLSKVFKPLLLQRHTQIKTFNPFFFTDNNVSLDKINGVLLSRYRVRNTLNIIRMQCVTCAAATRLRYIPCTRLKIIYTESQNIALRHPGHLAFRVDAPLNVVFPLPCTRLKLLFSWNT